MTNLPATISTANAQLPQSYEAAKAALAACTQVDECQDWADKAAALASYARQQDDDTLRLYALRIQARATRRVGELLKLFDSQGTRTDRLSDGSVGKLTMGEAAKQAGISERRQLTAVRVANVPEPEFTAAVESPTPPTLTALAEKGKKILTDPKPEGFNAAIHTLAAMRRFADKCRENDAELIAARVEPYDLAEVRECVATLDAWLDRFIVNLRG